MAEKLHDWQEAFALKEQLTQGDFEALEMAILDMPRIVQIFRNSDMSIARGAYLRAAIQAGWVLSPDCKSLTDDKTKERTFMYDGKSIDDMHPAHVRWLGQKVIDRHDAIMGEDPKNL